MTEEAARPLQEEKEKQQQQPTQADVIFVIAEALEHKRLVKEGRGDQQGFGTPLRAVLSGSLLPAATNLALGSCLLAATIQNERKTCQRDGSRGAL